MTIRRPLRALLMGALLLLPTVLLAQQVPTDRWNAAAIDWIHLLRDGDFEAAASRVDPAVPAGAMSADRLGQIWQQVSAQLGALESLQPGPVSESAPYHVVDLAGGFETQALTVRVVFNDSLQVSGFFFRPSEPPAYEAPAYVDTAAFHEVDVTVGAAPWELPGVLSVPDGDGPFPVVVLVHGSGPNDRDETIGGNRPFRDLAWGLASAGVAVLRYDKRTRVYGASLPPEIGLDEEVIQDALAALELAHSRPEVDPDRVFVLGHSLGGLVAPEIGTRAVEPGGPGVAGVIVMAGPARPFLDVIRGQLEYIAGLEPDPGSPNRVAIDSILRNLDAYDASGSTPDGTLMGVRTGYWDEVRAVDPVATAGSLDVPMLILQGGRDYQVTGADLNLWRQGLGDRDDVTFHLYPDLSHLFTPGGGMATPMEYTSEVKHVAGKVVEDIGAWVRAVR